MSKRAEEKALEAYPYQRATHFPDGFQEFDRNSVPRTIFQEGYEQAEKDLADVAAFSSGPDGFYYGKGYQQGKSDAEKHLGWHSVDESLPPVDEEVIVLTDTLGVAPYYEIAVGYIIKEANIWNLRGVKWWMPMPKLPKEDEK